MPAPRPITRLNPCEWCGEDIQPPKKKANGYSPGLAYYNKRRFCSRNCLADSRRGVPNDALRAETPERFCEVCGDRLERRRSVPGGHLEPMPEFMNRKSCAVTACLSEIKSRAMRGVNGFEWRTLHPANIVGRTLLAKTCPACGEFQQADRFRPDGYAECWTCLAATKRAKNEATRPNASRWGYLWTGPELELVYTRNDLSPEQLARMLGRTKSAVESARTAVRKDPRKRFLAGAPR